MQTVKPAPKEEIKAAIFDATYSGKEWYRCPHCRKSFEYYDTLYSEGFRKIADGVFIHVPCGGKIKIV